MTKHANPTSSAAMPETLARSLLLDTVSPRSCRLEGSSSEILTCLPEGLLVLEYSVAHRRRLSLSYIRLQLYMEYQN